MNKVLAYLHSKKVGETQGEREDVEILESSMDYNRVTTYIVKTQAGVKCTAIFNPFSCSYYADDIYGIIGD
jgi:hypothetical protein